MNVEETLQTFARTVELQLQQRYPDLQCHVWAHVDTATDEPIPMLVFDVQAVSPAIQVAHVLVGDVKVEEQAVTALVSQFGEVLTQSVQRAKVKKR